MSRLVKASNTRRTSSMLAGAFDSTAATAILPILIGEAPRSPEEIARSGDK